MPCRRVYVFADVYVYVCVYAYDVYDVHDVHDVDMYNVHVLVDGVWTCMCMCT